MNKTRAVLVALMLTAACTAAQLKEASTAVGIAGTACAGGLSGVSLGVVSVGSVCGLLAGLVQGIINVMPPRASALARATADKWVALYFGPHDDAHKIGSMHPDVAPDVQVRLDALAGAR